MKKTKEKESPNLFSDFNPENERETVYGKTYTLDTTRISKDKHINNDIIPQIKNAIKDAILKSRNAYLRAIGEKKLDTAELPQISDFVIATRKPPKYQGHVVRFVEGHIVEGNTIDLLPPSSDFSNRTIAFVNDDGSVDTVSLGSRTGFGGIAAMKQLSEKGGADLTHGSKLDLTGIKEVYVLDLDKAHNSKLQIFKKQGA